MGRRKAALKKLLFPGWGWVILAVLLGGASLAVTFLYFGETHPFAYVSYILSAYALTVLVAAVIPLFPAVNVAVHRVPLAHRYIDDPYFKVRSGLALSLFVDLCYAGLKLFGAVWYSSFWEGAMAIYYVILCAVRFYLLRRVPENERGQNLGQELRQYRATGIFLLALNLALSGVATQIVRDGYGSDYPGLLIYAAAAYSFYTLTIAVANAVRFQRFHSPVLSAAKAVNLTTALVSMFTLETAMLTQFNTEGEQFRLIMTACTALAVCLAVLSVAIFMVIVANKKLRRLAS